jgi:uncharacterized hydrophobic protein (TIGR00271 family)
MSILRQTLDWWRNHINAEVDHPAVVRRVAEDAGWTPRFAFMVIMSAAIAELGLLQSSPAVVIGAMLISPLMGPIMGLGFGLALFDFPSLKRSLAALGIAVPLAVAFTALIVLCSPLKSATPEILARTRPNLFDLVVALFSALAGTFALIRGKGDTIVGVAIATALMPPLATVGFGLATGNAAIAGGAFALFATNFVTIALSATIMARLYGFGHYLSSQQSWLQTGLLIAVFVVMAVPLGLSLQHIAREAVTTTQVRAALSGPRARTPASPSSTSIFRALAHHPCRADRAAPAGDADREAQSGDCRKAASAGRSAGRSGADRSGLQRAGRDPCRRGPRARAAKRPATCRADRRHGSAGGRVTPKMCCSTATGSARR